jgi:type IV pilus assembly protein PilB
MADPANVFAVDDIRSMTGLEVKSVVATKADVLAAIDRYHRGDDEMDELSSAIDVGAEDDDDLSKVTEVVEDAPIVKFVNLLITQAIQDRASDIHIEPAEKDLRVRFRIDGVLHEVMRSPKSITSGVTSRLKIMATSTSPSGASRRTAGCRSTPTARRSTCAWRPCPRCGARRSSCASWTTPRRC